jgi:hypothetical protein
MHVVYILDCMCYVKVVYRLLDSALKALVVKRYTTNWYQSEGFDTEPRWASGVVFGLRMQG